MNSLHRVASLLDLDVTFSDRNDSDLDLIHQESLSLQGPPTMDHLKRSLCPATDPHLPYYLDLPTGGRPLKVITSRFRQWQKVLHSLIVYYRSLCDASEKMAKIHMEMVEAVDFPMFANGRGAAHSGAERRLSGTLRELMTKTTSAPIMLLFHEPTEDLGFKPFGSGSIQDVPNYLIGYHRATLAASITCAQRLRSYAIPRLEALRDSLTLKIVEIKGLSLEFSLFEDLRDEIAVTGQYLDNYMKSLCLVDSQEPMSPSKRLKNDPFFQKLALDYQLSHQIMKEGFLRESYYNLQRNASELELIIVNEVQSLLRDVGSLVEEHAKAAFDMIIKHIIEDGFASKPAYFEWEAFVEQDANKNLAKSLATAHQSTDGTHGTTLKYRKASDIHYPQKSSFLSKCIKFGQLRRKTVLGSYKSCLYVLTALTLFEFESAKTRGGVEMKALQNATPTAAFDLNKCTVSRYTPSKRRFQLLFPSANTGTNKKDKQTNSKGSKEGIPLTNTAVFKADSSEEALQWYRYLRTLTGFKSSIQRAQFLEKNARKHNWKSVKESTDDGHSTSSHYKPESIKNRLTQVPPEVVISESDSVSGFNMGSGTSPTQELDFGKPSKGRFWPRPQSVRSSSSGLFAGLTASNTGGDEKDKLSRPSIFFNRSALNVLEFLKPSRHQRTYLGT